MANDQNADSDWNSAGASDEGERALHRSSTSTQSQLGESHIHLHSHSRLLSQQDKMASSGSRPPSSGATPILSHRDLARLDSALEMHTTDAAVPPINLPPALFGAGGPM